MPKVKTYLTETITSSNQTHSLDKVILSSVSSTPSDNVLFFKVLDLLSSIVLPEKKDFEFGASYGLVNLQFFHGYDTKLLAKGFSHQKIDFRIFNDFLILSLNRDSC